MADPETRTEDALADALSLGNIRSFLAFKLLFNGRFYYPVFMVLFLDYGLNLEQFALLNTVWAATIVLLEVPSGALADIVGRRNLVIFAGLLMVIEMLLLSLVPLGAWVFPAMVLNRILSGAAEASASGADEALAFDSLKARGLENQWPKVLERLMVLRGLVMFAAMLIGAAIYDPRCFNAVSSLLGGEGGWTKADTFRFPIHLNTVTAVLTFLVALSFQEVVCADSEDQTEAAEPEQGRVRAAFQGTWAAGRWILQTPLAFFVILTALLFDHCVRQLMTLSSEVFHVLLIPEFLYGALSAVFALLGIALSSKARFLAEERSPLFNLGLLGVLTGFALTGLALVIPYWGVLFVMLLFAAMSLLNFFLSHYLNQLAESSKRATILSFKGLAMNVAYGGIGLVYTGLIAGIRSQSSEELSQTEVFIESLKYFPPYFLVLFCLLCVYGWWSLKDKAPLLRAGGFGEPEA